MNDTKASAAVRPAENAPKYLEYNRKNGEYFEQLCKAVADDNLENVQKLLDTNPPPNFVFPMHFNPLQRAAQFGQTEIVGALLKAGADVHYTNNWNEEPLSFAIDGQHIECVKILLEAGADINLPSPRSDGQNGIHLATIKNNPALLETVLTGQKPNINQRLDNGNSALHLAASDASPPVIDILVAHGANLEPRNSLGDTPFLRAVRAGSIENAVRLFTIGANPEARTIFDETALHITESPEMAAFLLRTGIDPEAVDHTGAAPKIIQITPKPAMIREWKSRAKKPKNRPKP